MEDPTIIPLFVGALLIFVSVLLSKASQKLGLPLLLFFLAVGMLAGSEGPGGIEFDNTSIAMTIGITALIAILFYGGMDTQWESIKGIFWQGMILATAGVLITALIVGAVIAKVSGLTMKEGLLLGAIVSSTDAAAVFSILRSKGINLKGRLRPLLELESGSNDPMAVFLTMGIIALITGTSKNPYMLVPGFFLEMGVGFASGYLCGKFIVRVINRINLEYEGLYPVLSMALLVLAYAVTVHFHGNGFLSVYIAGLVIGNSAFIHKKNLTKFHESAAWMMQIIMFLTLGLLVFPTKLMPVAGYGIVAAVVLMLVARPVAVFACLAFSGFTFREKLLVSWVGLRGAVPVILAIFPMIAGITHAEKIFNIVFFVVIISALLQGSTISWLSKILGLEELMPSKRKLPLELEATAGIDADLNEVMIPFGSDAEGKRLFEIGIPKGALVTMITRDEQFIIPDGGTVLETGDIMLVMSDKAALKEIEAKVARQKEHEKKENENG